MDLSLSFFQLIASRAVALSRKVTCKSIHLKISQLYFNLSLMTYMFHGDRLLLSSEFEVGTHDFLDTTKIPSEMEVAPRYNC